MVSDQQTQTPWWLERLVLPAFFLLLGASLGRVKDWLDDRQMRKAFLAAIRVELSEIEKHMEGTLTDIRDVQQTFKTEEPNALHLLPVFQTGIYSSQVGKLRNVRDPRVAETIRFYDRLSNLERVKARATAISYELPILDEGEKKSDKARARAQEYASVLDEVARRITLLLPEVRSLISNLPKP